MKRAGDILRDYMRQRGWESADPYLPLFRCWEAVAGPQLGCHSSLAEVEAGVLLVEVDHPGWLQMLELRKTAILAAARAAAPGAPIEGLRGRISRGRPSRAAQPEGAPDDRR